MKKVNKDPFSNGSDHSAFETYCCDKCIKSSEPRDGGDGPMKYINQREDGMPKCAIQRDFILHDTLCPYMKTERKKYTKKYKNQLCIEF